MNLNRTQAGPISVYRSPTLQPKPNGEIERKAKNDRLEDNEDDKCDRCEKEPYFLVSRSAETDGEVRLLFRVAHDSCCAITV